MAGDDDRGLTFEQVQRKYEQKIFNLILRQTPGPLNSSTWTPP